MALDREPWNGYVHRLRGGPGRHEESGQRVALPREYGNQVCLRRPSYFSLIFRFRFPVVGVGDHQINGKFW